MKHDERPRIPGRTDMEPIFVGVKRELDPKGAEPPKKKRQKESRKGSRVKKHSHYVGVRWNDECKKWYASLHANGKHHYCGLYESECDAARAVNAKCGELDIPHKNKGLGVIQIRKKNKRSSRKSAYKGIYWVEKSQSWQVKIKYQKKLHSGGTFQDEYLAAQAANLLCVKLNIPQKNAEIGVSDILEKMKDGKIPPRRPRPRRKKNGANSYLRSPHNIRRQRKTSEISMANAMVDDPLFYSVPMHDKNPWTTQTIGMETAPTSPPLNHVPPIIHQQMTPPVKLEEIPVVPVTVLGSLLPTPLLLRESPARSPPALEIPQIKQEKIDQQVFNTIYESTQQNDAPHFQPASPERILARTENGHLKVRWKGFGPEEDTEEPVEKFKGVEIYKQFLEQEAQQKTIELLPSKKACDIST
jgi:hypothetical protein